MFLSNYTLLTFFCIIVFIISVDKNVADYLLLVFKMIKINLEKLKFLLILHPRNPITTWKMNRRVNKIARDLQKEFSLKDTQ